MLWQRWQIHLGPPQPSIPLQGRVGYCSPAQHSSTSRMLPGTQNCCLALCACFPMVKEESSGWQVPVLSSASCKIYSLSAQVCPPLRERPQISGTLNRAEHPSGCLTALDPASTCCQGALPHPWGPPFISQEQGQEKGCKLRDLGPCEVSVLLLPMAGVKCTFLERKLASMAFLLFHKHPEKLGLPGGTNQVSTAGGGARGQTWLRKK